MKRLAIFPVPYFAMVVLAFAWIHGQSVSALTPLSGTWDGTAASCPAPPAENPTLQGSGFAEKTAVNLDTPPYSWVETSPYTVTAAAFNGDPALGGIASVTFWLCGNSVTVSGLSQNIRTGTYGYAINLASLPALSGDASLYIYGTPINGYERRLGPIPFHLNNGSSNFIVRPQYLLDPVSGTDPANCTGTSTNGVTGQGGSSAPWKSVLHSSLCAGSGGVVSFKAGTTLEDSNVGTTNNNARTITYRPVPGVNLGDFIISRTARTLNGGLWSIRANKTEFQGVRLEMDKIEQITLAGVDANFIFDGGLIVDPNGVTGPSVSTTVGGTTPVGYFEVTNSLFATSFDQRYAVLNSTITNYLFTGATLARNLTATFSFDFSSMAGPIWCVTCTNNLSRNNNDSYYVNVIGVQPAFFKQREVQPQTVTALSVAANTPISGQYTVTWAGTPTITTRTGQANEFLEMTSGACAGETNRLPLVSQSAGLFQTVVAQTFNGYTSPCNPSSLASSDVGFSWLLAHPDCGQLLGQLRSTNNNQNPNIENVIFQQYGCFGAFTQMIFSQAGPQNIVFVGPSTMSTVGTAISSDVLTVASVGSFSGGQTIVTMSGSPMLNAIVTGSGYSPRFKVIGGPLNGQFFTVASQNNAAHTSTWTVDASNLCGGGACAGAVTIQAPLEQIAGNSFNVVSATGQRYEYARVVSTPTSSLDDVSATLDHAFTADQTSSVFSLVRSIKDWIIVSSAFAGGTDPSAANGQIQNGTQHAAIIQSTFFNKCILWRNAGAFATEDFSIIDSYTECNTPDAGPANFPGQSGGGNFSNIIIKSGSRPAGASLVPGATFDSTGHPTGGTLNGHTIGHTPLFARSLDGVPLTSSSLIGAQQP